MIRDDYDETTVSNDIAILSHTSTVVPACLPSDNRELYTGWEATVTLSVSGGLTKEVL